MKTLEILSTRIDALSSAQLQGALSFDTLKITVSKANSEFLLRSVNDKVFCDVLAQTGFVIPDGRGVQWAARYLTLPISDSSLIRVLQAIWQMIYSGAAIVLNPKFVKYPIPETFPGIEAFKLMLGVAVKEKAGIFLFGATDEVLKLAKQNIQKEFPSLKISGFLNGYDFQNDKSINPVDIINQTDAKMLFVALGSPKQEYWIRDNMDKLKNIRIAVGEGGTLDRVAYPAQASPNWINRLGLEWLWRLFMNKSKSDTGHRFARVWNAVPVFIYEVVKWKIKYGQTEV